MSSVGDRPVVFTLSGRSGCGKDLVGMMFKKYLEELGVSSLSISYADYLKSICTRNFGFVDKATDRKILQEFGTKVRELEEDFWVLTVFHTFDLLRNEYGAFIVCDARYKNELQPFPYNMYYPIVNVYVDRNFESGLTSEEQEHESEQLATNPNLEEDFHYVIDNNGTLEETYEQVVDIVNDVLMMKADFVHQLADLDEEAQAKLVEIAKQMKESDANGE